jgi:SAM-dependent methyltransferase
MNRSTTEQSPPAEEATPFDDGALYDIFFERLDLGLDFYLGLAQAAGGPVLDVACGTGRILLPCLKAGADVEGLDLFPGMLSRLRQKAAALGFDPKLHQANMAGFRLPGRYALIMIPFNAFVHNLTVDDQLATLQSCRDHLAPGGLLAFDTAFPGLSWIAQPTGTRELEMETPHPETGLPVRIWDTRTFDRVKQIQHSYNEIQMLDAKGAVIATHPSKTSIRWIYKTEMELLLRLAGFARWRILGGFDGRPLLHETDAMIVQAWTTPGASAKTALERV